MFTEQELTVLRGLLADEANRLVTAWEVESQRERADAELVVVEAIIAKLW